MSTTPDQQCAARRFSRQSFAAALDNEQIESALQHYHPQAEVRFLHLNRPRGPAELIVGLRSIGAWLDDNAQASVSHRVVKLAEIGNRLIFHEQRSGRDGVQVLEENMAATDHGLITCQ